MFQGLAKEFQVYNLYLRLFDCYTTFGATKSDV